MQQGCSSTDGHSHSGWGSLSPASNDILVSDLKMEMHPSNIRLVLITGKLPWEPHTLLQKTCMVKLYTTDCRYWN